MVTSKQTVLRQVLPKYVKYYSLEIFRQILKQTFKTIPMFKEYNNYTSSVKFHNNCFYLKRIRFKNKDSTN